VQILTGLLQTGGLSVLLIEHDMEVVFKLAHTIKVLHRGRVIADGVCRGSQTAIAVLACKSNCSRQ